MLYREINAVSFLRSTQNTLINGVYKLRRHADYSVADFAHWSPSLTIIYLTSVLKSKN